MACGTGAVANGTQATAVGQGATATNSSTAFGRLANAADSGDTALGFQAQASGASTAVGMEAVATGSASTAVGNLAFATGNHSTTTGTLAQASGTASTATGFEALAMGTNSTAIGTGAQANAGNGPFGAPTGNNATAVGSGAQANFDNSAAFGANVHATRANQMAFGTSSNTYTMAGITSGASAAAQSGPLQVVTSDANGNLATDGGAVFSRINELQQEDRRLRSGIAIAMAADKPIFHAGQTVAFNIGYGNFEGSNALGATAAGIVDRGIFGPGSTITVYAGGGVDTDGRTAAGKAGMSFGW
jgi:hypothetical protein